MDKRNFDPAEISNGRTSSNERMENVPLPNIPTHFLTPRPKSLLSATANDFENRHEAWFQVQISLDQGWYRRIESSIIPVKKDTGDTASVGYYYCQ